MEGTKEQKLSTEDGIDPRANHEDTARKHSIIGKAGEIINASGHRDQLQRHYGLLSICGFALTVDNAWVVLGTSISLAIGENFPFPRTQYSSSTDCIILANGGPPGVLYELITAVVWYGFIAASLAEV